MKQQHLEPVQQQHPCRSASALLSMQFYGCSSFDFNVQSTHLRWFQLQRLTHSFVATTLRSINSRPIQLQQLATSTFQRIQRLRIRNDAACISSSSLSNSKFQHDDISNTTTSATLATSTSLVTNEITPISSQPSAAADACACSAVSAQLQNQPQRSISIQPSAQQFGG